MRLKYKKMIFLITMWIMGIGMVTISFKKPQPSGSVPATAEVLAQNDPGKEKITNTPSPLPTLTPTPTPDPTLLKECEIPEINELIQTFYDAMINTDEDTLNSIVTNDSTINIEVISKKQEYIEKYENIRCYTKPGVNPEEYIVYLTYDMKITTIDTLAPCIDQCYVVKQDGTYKIQYNNFSDAITMLKSEYLLSEDVKALVALVGDNLNYARAADSDLDEFITNLTNTISQSSSSEGNSEANSDVEDIRE